MGRPGANLRRQAPRVPETYNLGLVIRENALVLALRLVNHDARGCPVQGRHLVAVSRPNARVPAALARGQHNHWGVRQRMDHFKLRERALDLLQDQKIARNLDSNTQPLQSSLFGGNTGSAPSPPPPTSDALPVPYGMAALIGTLAPDARCTGRRRGTTPTACPRSR